MRMLFGPDHGMAKAHIASLLPLFFFLFSQPLFKANRPLLYPSLLLAHPSSQGDPGPLSTYLFNAFDQNHNGQIDFREFITALSVTSRGDIHAKLEWAFEMIDINGDGEISKPEMVKFVDGIYRLYVDMRHCLALHHEPALGRSWKPR